MVEYLILYWYEFKPVPSAKSNDEKEEKKIFSESFIIDLNPRQDLEHQALHAARLDFEDKFTSASIWNLESFSVESIKKL